MAADKTLQCSLNCARQLRSCLSRDGHFDPAINNLIEVLQIFVGQQRTRIDVPEIERIDITPRMSRIVSFGDLVFLSGQTADSTLTNIADQTRDVLAKIEEKLAKAGSDKHHILSATIWLSDIRYFEGMNAVWDAWVSKEHPPARATVEARLANPALQIEIGIVAAKAS